LFDRHNLIGNMQQLAHGGRRADRCRDHDPLGTELPCHCARGAHAGAGCDAVVDDHRRFAVQVFARSHGSNMSGARIDRGAFPCFDPSERFRGNVTHAAHVFVENAYAVFSDGSHREFGLTRYAEFANDDHVERCVERVRHFRGHRNTAARKAEHDDVVAGEVRELRSKLPAGVRAVCERHPSYVAPNTSGRRSVNDVPSYVSLLRAVNVGGRRSVPMAPLRALYESLGFENVQSYVQSGNVVFAAKGTAASLRARIEKAIRAEFKIDVDVALRTAAEMRKIVAANPYVTPKADLKQLHVTFLTDKPTAGAIKTARSLHYPPDEFVIAGSQLYLCTPNGIGRTKLNFTAIEKALGVATTRNWNTVTKLLAMVT
jgi:uncharacterized protein (DUF1697 family)